MSNPRLIARLDIKMADLIKGIHLEGWRKIGNPWDFAKRYYDEGADELLYMDVVASLYDRNNLTDIVRKTAAEIFIPLCVGGGVRSLEDASNLLRAGADKIALNTAATKRPELIAELAQRFGSQCIVLSLEAKQIGDGKWEAYTDNGREKTGLDAVDWAVRGVELGAGEVLITSVDRDGTFKGFDLELIECISSRVSVPVIACGGLGAPEHMLEAFTDSGADAVAAARAIHTERTSLTALRQFGLHHQLPMRQI